MTDEDFKELQEFLIQVSIKVAKRGEGAIFAVGGNVPHKPLVEQSVPPFKVTSNPKLLESLALMDGAIIIDEKGILVAYGTMIKSSGVFHNYGTRHSAAISASKKAKLVVMVSEEDKKVRIFKAGKMVMQIDPFAKGIEKSVTEAVNVLESVGAGTLGAIGTTLLVPSLGIYLVPGIVLFGSAYYLAKGIKKHFG
ncbi:MAG: DNA integrity scanning protein DisA nucleotide-binding domain protein [Nanoarchaeota archaeon]|nr:DNA integrity scanning protein DisA nucleotide-binding domain protein [Nanoarchaeota archaeon]MBU0977184.1 DNA integrity scanning protein DisA nucleotide-binding domain protein [Nanoarchaeota archaeon]